MTCYLYYPPILTPFDGIQEVGNFGHVCERFMTQIGKAWAIITGILGPRPFRDLGNKK